MSVAEELARDALALAAAEEWDQFRNDSRWPRALSNVELELLNNVFCVGLARGFLRGYRFAGEVVELAQPEEPQP